MPRLSELSIDKIYQLAGSTAPTPGGGSVTALCGLLGIALILKALRITRRHRPGEALDTAESALESLAAALEADAEDDAIAFDAFIQAVRLPKDDEDQQTERTEQMQHAAAAAAAAALDTLEHANAAIEQAERIHGDVAAAVLADIRAGSRMVHVTIQNAIDNANGNIESAGPETVRDGLLARLASLTPRSAGLVRRDAAPPG